MRPVLFVTHKRARCGVYEFGKSVADAIGSSTVYRIDVVECQSPDDYHAAVRSRSPVAVIYNHHPSTLPWLKPSVVRRHRIPHLGILHEVSQEVADGLDDSLFDFHIAPDPTLLLRNPIVFKTGRLVPRYEGHFEPPQIATIGSFGFATEGKGFERLVAQVDGEFDEALVRLHIPYASFADSGGERARAIAERCRRLATTPGIRIDISHEYLDTDQLLDFLAQNSINAFLYEPLPGRGISSVVELALAARRPFAITRSSMFRHVLGAQPAITIEGSSLRKILSQGFAPVAPYAEEWTAENLRWDYERILKDVLRRPVESVGESRRASGSNAFGIGSVASVISEAADQAQESLHALVPLAVRIKEHIRSSRYVRRAARSVRARVSWTRRLGRAKGPARHANGSARTVSGAGDWVPPSLRTTTGPEPLTGEAYRPIAKVPRLNRILDDSARALYAPAITYLYRTVPSLMARKIPEANVQQAFVLDTVVRSLPLGSKPRLMCVGSYEDTAAAGVRASGYSLDEIDSVLNFDLATYMTKPSRYRGGFDAVFATSVIEHVADDESFISQIEELLAVGGLGVLTCDFNDAYHSGDRLPTPDFRFYTARDLQDRLLSRLSRSELVDTPDWTHGEPDFVHDGCRYTFASFVFRRVR